MLCVREKEGEEWGEEEEEERRRREEEGAERVEEGVRTGQRSIVGYCFLCFWSSVFF